MKALYTFLCLVGIVSMFLAFGEQLYTYHDSQYTTLYFAPNFPVFFTIFGVNAILVEVTDLLKTNTKN